MGTAFTYQGRLMDANEAADGVYDFQFKLLDAPSGPNQVGGDVNKPDVNVIDGYFTVELDFNEPNAFNGDARWLEIGVRPGSASDPCQYTTLAPRQEVTPAPYALYAKSVGGLEAPLILTGSVAYPGSVIEATNTSTGIDSGYAVVGKHSDSGNWGGLANSIYGAWGSNSDGTNFGGLGGNNYGVYGTSTSGTGGYFTSSYGYGLIVDQGNVGIGTTDPCEAELVVSTDALEHGVLGKNNANGTVGVLGYRSATITAGAYGKNNQDYYGTLGAWHPEAGHCGVFGHAGNGNNFAALGTAQSAGHFRGNVTIRDANGIETIRLNGTTGWTTTKILEITGGSDLSEQFDIGPQNGRPEPGMVVSIDRQNPGKLVLSSRPYERTVAGIVSGAGGVNTGMLMGHQGSQADGANPVALTGRVYCWADASNNPIEPGDLLTTSDTPGHAMKATDREKAYGTVIGKAMTSLDSGKGLVLVLVNLQ
jgi:hypothetical protein